MSEEAGWGLAAISLHGDIEINIHRRRSAAEAWELEIRAMNAYLRFRISGPATVKKMELFLSEKIESWQELEVGSLGSTPVLLVRDHPPAVRCWLKVIFEDGCASVTFADEEADHLLGALHDTVQELNLDG